AGQGRKEHGGQDGRGYPGHDDDPAEPDGEPPEGGVKAVHGGSPRFSGGTGAGAGGWWRGVEADHLVTAQRLKERLEAPADQAAQRAPVDLHVTDPGRAPHLVGRSGADETDLYSPYRQLLSHVPTLGRQGRGRHRWNYRSGA